MAAITQRESGRWQAKIRREGWPDQSKTFDTDADAKKWARAVEREMDIGAFINRNDAEKTSFANAAKRYTEEVLPGLRGKASDASRLGRLVERFGKFSLASITTAMIASYRDERLKVVAPQTVVHEINLLQRIFKTCTMDWGIAMPQGVPTALVRKPTVDNARSRRLEEGEWELLAIELAGCASTDVLAAVELAIETGARQSELMSIKFEDVNIKDRTLRLRGMGGGITKNGDKYRDIPLSPHAIHILKSLPLAPEGKIFTISQSALKQSFERAVDRARQAHMHRELTKRMLADGWPPKQPEDDIRALIYKKKEPSSASLKILAALNKSDALMLDLHFHDLRHEACSRLADRLTVMDLAKVTGHRDLKMVMRYYQPRMSSIAMKLA